MDGKVVIFSAPSGSGKSTLVSALLRTRLPLAFSVSATTRPPRGAERNGVDYYFLGAEEFRRRVAAGDFVEHEEVYAGCFYGTLRSELHRLWEEGKTILFDVDVKGGINLKRIFGGRALTIFVQPPSIEELRRRLVNRGTDTPEKIEQRVAKATEELAFAPQFDRVVVNDDLSTAVGEVVALVTRFIHDKGPGAQ